jgi:hypothetical protein
MNKTILAAIILISAHIFAGEVLASAELPQIRGNEFHIPIVTPYGNTYRNLSELVNEPAKTTRKKKTA